jgi:hypothetical protein
VKLFTVAASVVLASALLGCGEGNPCGEGRTQTEPAGLFAEIGLPKGAAHCVEGDLEPRLFFLGMTEAQAAYAMREQMSKQGWQPLELTAAVQEGMRRDLSAGGSARTTLLFGKDGAPRRFHVIVQAEPGSRLAILSLGEVECPDPKTTLNERSPEQRGWCP